MTSVTVQRQSSMSNQTDRHIVMETLTRSSVVIGCPLRLVATTIFANRFRMSSRLLVRASTAMISLATVMSNWA